MPSRSGRREIIDYYVDKKAHVPELDKEERRDTIAAMTFGYTPVMLEHLFDEALVWAFRDNRDAMDFNDVQQAKMTTEIGLKQPVEYEEEEKRTIATHEAGHTVVAYLVGRTASSRCCRSSSAVTRSACSRTPTAKSGSRRPVPS